MGQVWKMVIHQLTWWFNKQKMIFPTYFMRYTVISSFYDLFPLFPRYFPPNMVISPRLWGAIQASATGWPFAPWAHADPWPSCAPERRRRTRNHWGWWRWTAAPRWSEKNSGTMTRDIYGKYLVKTYGIHEISMGSMKYLWDLWNIYGIYEISMGSMKYLRNIY